MAVDMHGISAGQAGALLEELQRRGLLPAVGGDLRHLIPMPTRNGKTVGAELREGKGLRQILDENPTLKANFAGEGIDRVARLLAEWSAPVAAARDLLGFHGKIDPSMRDMFEIMEKITAGSVVGLPPAAIATSIRRIHHMTQDRPGSLDTYLAAVQTGGQLTAQVGLDRSFAAMTAQASVGFGMAFERRGGLQGLGGLSRDEASALDQQLRVAAGASPLANALGAVMAMDQAGLIKGQALNLVNAIKTGNTSVIMSSAGSPAQIMQLLQASGVSSATARQYMVARGANQEYIARNGIQDTVRQVQGPGEIAGIMRMGLQSGMAGVLAEAGIGRGEISTIQRAAADAAQRALMGMTGEQLSSPEQVQARNRIVADAIEAAVPDAARRLGPGGMQNLAGSAISGLEALMGRHSGLRKFKNLAGLVTMNRGDILAEGHVIQGQAQAQGQLAGALAGVQSGVRGAVDAIGGAGASTRVWDIFQAGMGNVMGARSPDWRSGGLSALRARDREVRLQESLHHKMAGPWALGSPQFSYQIGEDGHMYASSGQVMMDVSPISGNPHATMAKMATIEAAAMAPAHVAGSGGVSQEDLAIASRASGLRQAAAAAAMPARSPGGAGVGAGGASDMAASSSGPLRITGTLTLRSDGTADIDAGWNAMGSPPAPPAL